MSHVVTLPLDQGSKRDYNHASVNYNWEVDKRCLYISVLTLPKAHLSRGPKQLDLSGNKLVDLSNNKLRDLSGNKLVDLSANKLRDLSGNRIVDLSNNKLKNTSGVRPINDLYGNYPYLELIITYNKVIPGKGITKVTRRVHSNVQCDSFYKTLSERELFGEIVPKGSHIDILKTELISYKDANSRLKLHNFGNHNGKDDSNYAASCVLEGTKILTPSGWQPVETIKPGDKILAHNGHERIILKRAVWTLKYENSPVCNDGRVFRVERGYAGAKEPVYVSYHHKVFMHYKQFIKAGHAKFKEASREEIAPLGFYRLYNIQSEDHKRNHLLVGGGLIIESWDGKMDPKSKPQEKIGK